MYYASSADLVKWKFPKGMTIPKNQYLVVIVNGLIQNASNYRQLKDGFEISGIHPEDEVSFLFLPRIKPTWKARLANAVFDLSTKLKDLSEKLRETA